MARSRPGTDASPLRPAQAHHQAVVGPAAWFAKATPTRRCSCIRNWPTWPATELLPPSPDISRTSAPSKRCSIRITRLVPQNTSGSTHRRHLVGRQVPNTAISTGLCSTVIGKASFAASLSRTLRSFPTSKTTILAWKFPTATVLRRESTFPISSFWWMTATVPADPLHLVVEIKGYRREDAKEKKSTMDTYWVPGVNHLGTYGRWAFAEFTEIYQIEADFKAKVESEFNKMLASAIKKMTTPDQPIPEKVHRFLDEAGDTTFFGKGRVPMLGKDGASPLIRPTCVLRRLPFDGVEPTFRHRRPKQYVSQMELACKRFRAAPRTSASVRIMILPFCRRRQNGPAPCIPVLLFFPLAVLPVNVDIITIRSLRVGPPVYLGRCQNLGAFSFSTQSP